MSTDILANRLNIEPVIFRGCSSSELGLILLGAVLFWVPTSFLIALLLGRVPMALGISGLGVLGSVFIGATVFQHVKRGRPDHYYQHCVIIWLHERGLKRSALIRQRGHWSLGRDFFER